MNVWDHVVAFITGKDVALLGPRSSGKTTLYSLLRTGEVAHDPSQTIAPTRQERARNHALAFNIQRGTDLPGADRAYPDWKRQFITADVVFYLFDAHQLRTQPSYAARVDRDGRAMREWGCKEKRMLLLGTHADADPLHSELGAARYADEIMDNDVVAGLYGRVRAYGAEVGSLKTTNTALPTVRSLLER